MHLSDHRFLGGRLVHRRQWLAEGISRRRLASPEFTTIIPGYSALTRSPPSLLKVAEAVLYELPPGGAALYGATAAELLGLTLPPRLRAAQTGHVHVLALGDRRIDSSGPRRAHNHRSGPPVELMTLAGLSVPSPLETLCQIAPHMTKDEVITSIDAALDHERCATPLTLPELTGQLDQLTGRRGAAAVRRALPHAREGVRSPWETRARLLVLGAGYPDPTPNYWVRDPVTGASFCLDLAFLKQKICIEYDGDWHRTDRERFRRDRMKDAVLRRLGWEVVRITVEQVVRPETFLAHLAAVWQHRASR